MVKTSKKLTKSGAQNSKAKKKLRKAQKLERAAQDQRRWKRTDAESWNDMRSSSLQTKPTTFVAKAGVSEGSTSDAGNLENSSVAHSKSVVPAKFSSELENLAGNASVLLSLAFGISILFLFAAFGLEDGRRALSAIGGFPDGLVDNKAANIVLLLDLVFPAFLYGGLAVLATSFQNRGNRPLIRLVLTMLMVVFIADIVENSMVHALISGQEASLPIAPFTWVKFMGLAFSSVALSAVLRSSSTFGSIVRIVLRYVMPIAMAILISSIGGDIARDVISALFSASILILALFAASLAQQTDQTG